MDGTCECREVLPPKDNTAKGSDQISLPRDPCTYYDAKINFENFLKSEESLTCFPYFITYVIKYRATQLPTPVIFDSKFSGIKSKSNCVAVNYIILDNMVRSIKHWNFWH